MSEPTPPMTIFQRMRNWLGRRRGPAPTPKNADGVRCPVCVLERQLKADDPAVLETQLFGPGEYCSRHLP